MFFHCSKQFLKSSILVSFIASAVFFFVCFTSSISAKHFPLRTFLIRGNKKSLGEIRWIGKVGHRDHAISGQKLLTINTVWAGALLNYPSWNGETCWKSLQKKFTEAKCSLSQQCQLVHWYRWVPGTLTLLGEACTTKGPPSRRWFQIFWVHPHMVVEEDLTLGGGHTIYLFLLWSSWCLLNIAFWCLNSKTSLVQYIKMK